MKNSFNSLTVLFIGLLLNLSVQAQTNFVPAKILFKNQTDSVTVQLDYRNWAVNPKSIDIINAAGKPETLYPEAVAAFTVAGYTYRGATVEVEKSSDIYADLTRTPNYLIDRETLFLREIIAGDRSLYYYDNDFGKDLFYIYENGKFDLLLYKRYLDEDSGVTIVRKTYDYRKQLLDYFQDCADIVPRIMAAEFTRTALEKLFTHYGKCTNANIKLAPKEKGYNLKFGAVGGLNLSRFNFGKLDPNFTPYLARLNFGTSFNPMVGLSFEFVSNKDLGRVSFYNEIAVSGYRHTSETNPTFTNDEVFTVTLGGLYLKHSHLLRYRGFLKNPNLFSSIGIAYTHRLSETQTARRFPDELNGIRPGYSPVRIQTNFLLGIGYRMERLSFELRYDRDVLLRSGDFFYTPFLRLHFLAGYQF